MIKYFYEVNYVIFYYYDESDKENVEDIFFAGYFSSLNKAKESIRRMMLYSKEHNVFENYKITKRRVTCEKPPKYLYRSYYEYSIILDTGKYVDYSYVFSPKATKKEAEKLCRDLRQHKKYQKQEGRDYSAFPPDGFGIEKIEVDYIWYHDDWTELGEQHKNDPKIDIQRV